MGFPKDAQSKYWQCRADLRCCGAHVCDAFAQFFEVLLCEMMKVATVQGESE